MNGRILALPARPWAALALLAVLAGLAVANWAADTASPSPAPADAPERAFSADRAWDTVEAVAAEPHPIGTDANDRVRDLLVDRLETLGFNVEVETGPARDTADGRVHFGSVANIVATLPGTDPTGTVLLTSHYDSVPSGPGAADAASGVAALVETARALSLDRPHRNDIVVLLTDGEEMGLLGAEAYTRAHPATDRPTVVHNLEARGVSGPSLMFETSEANAELIDLFASAAPHPHGDSSAIEAYRQLPNDTDFTRFAEAGYIGLNTAFIGGASWYHTPRDDTDHLDPASLQHHGENALGVARELSGMDLTELEADRDRTFFGFLGALIHYDQAWNAPLAFAGLAAALAAAGLARARRLLSLPRLAGACLAFTAPITLAAAAAIGLWPALQALRPGYADTFGLLFNRTFYYLAILAFALAAVAAWYVLLRGVLGRAALALAPLMWLAGLGIATAFAVPGASFVFAVPALAAVGLVVAMALERRRRALRAVGYAVFALSLVPVVVQLSWTSNLIEAFGMELAAVPAVLIVLFAAPVLPVATMFGGTATRAPWFVPSTAAVSALALVAAGLAVDRFDADRPRQAYLSYVIDADSGVAAWVSRDRDRSEWTSRYVTEDGLEGSGLPEAYVAASAPVTGHGTADPVDLEPPQAAYVAQEAGSVTLHLSSPRGANTMWLAVDGGPERAEVALPDGTTASAEIDPPADGEGPTQIWFYNVPDEGVTVTVHGQAHLLDFTVFDQSHGLEGLDGFTERPDGLMRSRNRLSDTVTVATQVIDAP
ncbi:M28 family peptidase [Glycomyces xiaoerkulensis]|uniref:M28 family peptidase n=1 Tax=Glycomyces xiaoerkulensis TaxID=2038139 RepID=UPI000C2690FF|nr:M28 family peptidase [Glycomyces xiaoerkulensis]